MFKKSNWLLYVSLLLLTVGTFGTYYVKGQTNQLTPQDDPYVSVKLKVSEWDKVIAIIHNAPVVGAERDPIINAITTQARIQLAPKTDSTQAKNAKVDSTLKKDAYKKNQKDRKQ